MTLRIKFAIGVGLAAIILPIVIVQAQSEGETQPVAPEETAVVEQPAAEVTVPQEESTPAAEAPQEEAAAVAVAQDAAAPEEAPADTATAGGEVLGESDVATEEPAAPEEPATTTPVAELLVATTASSTEATSTPPVTEEPKPIEEPFVLQPAVRLAINGSSLAANIELQNLTCKSCEKELPELEVKAYYTEWYPNDGPAKDYNQSHVRMMEQAISVAGLANWATRDMTWSAENIAPGSYYFVVEVDPENAHGAHYLFRSEFAI